MKVFHHPLFKTFFVRSSLKRILFFLGSDAILLGLAFYLSFYVRFEGAIPEIHLRQFFIYLPVFVGLKIIAFYLFQIHREDAARACLSLLNTPNTGINIYNVSAPPCTMRDVVDELASALERHVPNLHIPPNFALSLTGGVVRLARGYGPLDAIHANLQKWLADDVYNASKFEETFNFKTKVELAEGLNREVVWYRRYNH